MGFLFSVEKERKGSGNLFREHKQTNKQTNIGEQALFPFVPVSFPRSRKVPPPPLLPSTVTLKKQNPVKKHPAKNKDVHDSSLRGADPRTKSW